MTTIALYGLATFAALFGGGILGLLAGKLMPEKYHDDSTRAIVQTATGMVSLLAALVLGLLVATAKNKFDTSNKQTEEYAASLMLLDRELVNFGPGANETNPCFENIPPQKSQRLGIRQRIPNQSLAALTPGNCLRVCS